MKIGILTYHRSYNFGALLQAVATRVILTELGHEVSYIDYWPDYHLAMYSLFSWKTFKREGIRGKCIYVKKCIQGFPFKKKSYRKYREFIRRNIEPYCVPIGSTLDVIIYGSDQIWRKQPWMNTYNPIYFGVNSCKAQIHASYAASMGILPSKDSVNDKRVLKSLLTHLDHIAVREESLQQYIQELGFSDVRLCIDPVLLLEAETWDKLFPPANKSEKRYVLFVNYIPNSFNEIELRKFANRNHYDFIKINGTVLGKDTIDAIVGASPIEILDYIRNASIVFSSSFHALVFAILYKKVPFAAFAQNGDRAKSLLNRIGLSSFYLTDYSLLNSENYYIDYKKVHKELEVLRHPSLRYLSFICSQVS